MFDFGDELIIDTYRIPWLIWIQLIVMFLLILLLYFYTFDDHSTPSAHDPSSSNPFSSISQEPRENQIFKEPGSHASREIERNEDITEAETSSGKDETSDSHFRRAHHPCHFLGIAKQAFLKCLGLDFSPESSSNSNERRD
ncbi:hypothetical protein AG4045_024040 [Apium graveolens]|uniref:Transmembrane protein n=1 Tax=Apium graveolens TaxID=4045 RepID=A0A6L5BE09_APIGR|nr:hypothetical protein AG4045_024040 [Apium graveolens]